MSAISHAHLERRCRLAPLPLLLGHRILVCTPHVVQLGQQHSAPRLGGQPLCACSVAELRQRCDLQPLRQALCGVLVQQAALGSVRLDKRAQPLALLLEGLFVRFTLLLGLRSLAAGLLLLSQPWEVGGG